MGALALEGRDKLTLVADERVASLGLWIEQLVAESTGKEGQGVVPVAGEPLAAPEAYADDRLFVAIHVGEADEKTKRKLHELEEAGHTVVRRTLTGKLDLCAEFFVWELATAVAGALMKINPFDQPNVQESKDNTNALLEEFKRAGALPEQAALAAEGELKVYGANTEQSGEQKIDATLSSAINALLASSRSGDYIALLAYLQETEANEALLQEIRTELRDALRVATTTGYGPRFLHSTGQLHKGGADKGIFIQLTDEDAIDLKIPGEPYTFSILKQAQALGDFSSLASRNRRALRLHLGRDAERGLRRLLDIVRSIAKTKDAARVQSRST
jgi:hypothetical protein